MAFSEIEQELYGKFKQLDLLNPDYAYPFIDFCDNVLSKNYEERKPILDMCNKVKNEYYSRLTKAVNKGATDDELVFLQEGQPIFWDILKMEARNRQFDSYCMYLEKNREPKEKFYQPRRQVLRKHGVIQAFQQLIDDELDILGVSMPPGTAKTTCEKFFHSAVVGWYPMDFSLFYSHSGDITRMYYDGVYDIVTNADEYVWNDIFPNLSVTSTNAKLEQFNVGKYKPFPSVQCTSVGAKNAGKVRASRFLFVDDMVASIEEALNKNTLDKLWNAYTVDARQRKVQSPYDGVFCKELHIQTRWSTQDILGRLKVAYEDDPRVKFIAIPDIDPQTGRSNFEYEIGGYTVENFRDIEMTMDDISYRCLYKQDPIEREGQLYNEDDLRRFKDLPSGEPDAILGVCDTKEKGTDFMVLPMAYNYGGDYYIVDCVCDDNADFGVQYEKLTNLIVRHKAQQVEFESNAGGLRIAFEVEKRVKEQGCGCNITTKYTESNKETRIIANADWVKKHCVFLEKTEYSAKSDYGKMMSQLVTYCVGGKNKHDDVVDDFAIFHLFVERLFNRKKAHFGRGLF